MKIRTTIAVLFCFILSVQGQTRSDESAVMTVIKGSFDHIFSDLNPEVIENYFTSDFILLEDGKVWSNDSIRIFLTEQVLPHVEKLREENHHLERINHFDFIKISILGNTAWVAYRNTGVFKIDGDVVDEVHWLESATLVKTPQGWRIQMLHSTDVEQGTTGNNED